ncbi:MAG: restriction endonuclease subunit S [Selenomonas massiliensis]
MDTEMLRKKILDLAIRGKLVPQDPNDEPASVLLEQIRAQKAQMVKDGKLKAKDVKNDTIIYVGEDNLHYEKFADGTIKCIEDEIPFEIPESWAWVRLQSISTMITDGTHKTPQYSNSGYIFLSSRNVTSGKIDWDNIMYISESLHQELYSRVAPRIGDILLAKNGTTGAAAIIDEEKIFDIYVSLALIRTVKDINSYFTLYAIRSTYVQAHFFKSLKGIGVPNLHLEHIRHTLIPIPPISEQGRCVSKIEKLIPIIASIQANKENLIETINTTKSKILDLAIRGKLVPQDESDEPASVLLERIQAEKKELIRQEKIKRDKRESVIYRGADNSYYERFADGSEKCIDEEIPFEIPKGWTWCRGCSCFKPMQNTKPTGDYFDYIDIDAVDNVHHNIKSIKHLSVQNAPSRARRIVPKDSVLFSLVRPYLKNIVLITDRYSHCIASTGFYVCISNGILNPKYMELLMCSEYVVQGLMQFMKGDNSPSINNTHIENWLYPVPPLSLQKRIAKKVLEIEHHIEILDYN